MRTFQTQTVLEALRIGGHPPVRGRGEHSPVGRLRGSCCLLGAFSLLLGCGDNSATSDAGSETVGTTADVSTGGEGTGSTGSTGSTGETSGTGDTDNTGADWAHCPILDVNTPPAWAQADDPTTGLVARCDDVDLHVRAHTDGVARLTYVPRGEELPSRSFAVSEPPAFAEEVQVGAVDGDAVLCTADYMVRITESSCRIRLDDSAGQPLLDDGDFGGWSTAPGTQDDAPVTTVSVTRATPEAERFYGLGERNGPLNQRGRSLVFWNTDAYDPDFGGFGPEQDPLYQSIPFFIGLREGTAYGVLTDNAYRQEMDLAATSSERYQIKAFGGAIDQYIMVGERLPEVVRRYTALTGRMSPPPRWSLGYHQCRWGYAPESKLTELAAEFRGRQIPADSLWLDIQHMDGFRTFTWDPVDFPDPEGLIADLGGDGFRVTVIADPGIKLDPGWSVYDSGLDAGAYLEEPGGEVYVGEVWPGDSVFPDFTDPAARSWWAGHVAELVERGVQGVWLDVNEPTNFPESGGGNTVPNSLPIDGDGIPSTMAEGHNVYALHEARATYEGMLQAAPEQRPFILTRAAYAGIQRWAAAWTGDAPSTWTSLGQSLPMLLNMGLSGEAFVGSDVGGYSGGATPELFARWMSVGVVSPFLRGHVTNGVKDQEPWAFGQEVEDISRAHINWRYEILPYIYSLFDEAARSGAPVLRPLVYAYQEDPETHEIGDQALLGPNLLVAPVVEEGADMRQVYLPAGRWFEYRSGAVYEGPQWIDVPVTLAALPRYVPEGAILPHGELVQHTGEIKATDRLLLQVYPGPEETAFTLYEDAGEGFAYRDEDCFSRTTYRTQRLREGARFSADPREGSCPPEERPLELRVRRVDHAPAEVVLDGDPLQAQPDLAALHDGATGWWWDPVDLSLVIRFADRDDFEVEMHYDPSLLEERPPVDVPLVIHVPEGTPQGAGDPPVHIVTHVDGWSEHQPLSWGEPNTAEGVVRVPRGEWFWFKYTRGDWDTVEKWPQCEEADNHYGFGEVYPGREDTVYEWADLCP